MVAPRSKATKGDALYAWVGGGVAAVTLSLPAVCAADLTYVANDNGFFYVLQQSDLTEELDSIQTWDPEGENPSQYYQVCSSPAITYRVGDGARWVFVVSRGDNGRGGEDGIGTLFAFRTE